MPWEILDANQLIAVGMGVVAALCLWFITDPHSDLLLQAVLFLTAVGAVVFGVTLWVTPPQ